MRAVLHRCVIVLAVLACAVSPCIAQAVEETELKAAIVFNILLFVDWPSPMLAEAGAPLVLCVGPNSGLQAALKALVGRDVRGHRLALRELGAVDAARPCHAVFIDAADRRLSPTLKTHTAAGALVVSDDAEAPKDATAIVLRRTGSRIALDVHMQPVRQARLQLSSKLLRLARVVKE